MIDGTGMAARVRVRVEGMLDRPRKLVTTKVIVKTLPPSRAVASSVTMAVLPAAARLAETRSWLSHAAAGDTLQAYVSGRTPPPQLREASMVTELPGHEDSSGARRSADGVAHSSRVGLMRVSQGKASSTAIEDAGVHMWSGS